MKTAEEVFESAWIWSASSDLTESQKRAIIEAMEEYAHECVKIKCAMPNIDDINKFINEHEGNTGNALFDKAIDAGFREGAKFVINWINDNKR